MPRKRDVLPGETPYQARNRRARAQGFESYNDYRRKVAAGETPPLAPHRLRSPKSKIAYRKYIFENAGVSEDEIYRYVQFEKEQMSIEWSRAYSKEKITRFSTRKARTDPGYVDLYFTAFVANSGAKGSPYILTPSKQLHDFFVRYKGMTEDDWKLRYGRRRLLTGAPSKNPRRKTK